MGRGIISWRSIFKEIRIRSVSSKAKALARKYGYRPYMVERYLRILGYDDTVKLLKSFEKPVKPVIRCNDLRVNCKWLIKRLESLGFRLEYIGWSIHGYRVLESPSSPTIGSTHEYLKGYYYVHRDAAPLIPQLLLLYNNWEEVVLDACAAPGGKATHLAQLLGDRGVVIANDIVLSRLMALISHVLRMGYTNIVVTWCDLRKMPRLVSTRFSRILLDVPCSGEGTIMLDPGRKTRTTQVDLARIVAREIEILQAGLSLLKPGGILAYTTCSIAPEENEYVVSKILSLNPDVKVVEPPIKLLEWSNGVIEYGGLDLDPSTRKCIRIWPHLHGMIGFTICLLTKQ